MFAYRKSGRIRIIANLTFLISFACFGEIRVTDDLGREIVLSAPASRIVSLAPHNTENLFTAGAGELIVGTVDHSDFPEQALAIPRVGNYKQINIETIIGLKPDLVVAWSSGNRKESIERLIDFGLPVFYSEPITFEQIIGNVERLAQLTGRVQYAAPELEQMRNTHVALQKEYLGKLPVKVFFQVWNEPLITLNRDHSVNQAFDLCSGVNIFADEPTIAPRVSVEGVVAKNPQLILLAGHNQRQSAGWVDLWSKWPSIEAVSADQVKHVDANIINRPTRRFLQGTAQICQLIAQARRGLK